MQDVRCKVAGGLTRCGAQDLNFGPKAEPLVKPVLGITILSQCFLSRGII